MSGLRSLAAGAAGAVTLAVAVVAAGCGIPTGGQPDTIPSGDVPYGLTSPTASAPSVTSPPPRVEQPRVFFVAPDNRLVGQGRELSGDTLRNRLADLLSSLADGPATTERENGLTTALPPNVRLTVRGVDSGVATVDIEEKAQGPSGLEGRRAAAQIVLTATSLPGVHAVLLAHDGAPLDAPLPSGRLTSEPLTAADYLPLLTPSPSA